MNLCLIAQDYNTSIVFSNQIRELLKDKNVEVASVCLDKIHDIVDYINNMNHYDLYVVSCEPVYNKLIRYDFNANNKVIIAKLTLNKFYLNKLFDFPKNKSTLVVTCFKETAIDTVKNLINNGFNKMIYIPYYPGCNIELDGIDMAITGGVPQLVPPEINNIIDIGIRSIDVSTLAKILLFFDIPIDSIDNISNVYIGKLISLSTNYSKMTQKANELNAYLLEVIGNSDDGIVALDKDNKIIDINVSARNIMDIDISSSEINEQHIRNIIDSIDLESGNDILHTLKGKKVLIKKKEIQTNNDITGKVYYLKLASRIQRLENDVRIQLLQDGNIARYTFNSIVGSSTCIIKAINQAKTYAVNDFSVLILGESGTGKELFAQSIHNYSKRNNCPFIAVNFAALPESLAESELFGYEEGSFTGALKGGKLGLFEQAHGGTIFLDEIGDASIQIQTRLLRIIEEKKVRRIGSNKVLPVDFRIIAATNKNLKSLISEGKFREDLFYRLHVLLLNIPSLRERKDDLPTFIDYYLRQFDKSFECPKEIINILENYNWPGNIRQLENVLKFLWISLSIDKNDKNEVINYLIKHYLHDEGTCYSHSHTDTANYSMQYLSKYATIEEYAILLKSIKQSDGMKNIGRKRIIDILNGKGHKTSEARIRKILSILHTQGYVYIGRTSQGTRITNNGIMLLNEFEKNTLKSDC